MGLYMYIYTATNLTKTEYTSGIEGKKNKSQHLYSAFSINGQKISGVKPR